MSTFDSPLFNEVLFDEGAAPTPNVDWDLGDLWSITSFCAKEGLYGLGRQADGITGSSDTTSNNPITVRPGQTLFASFWLRGSGGADGTISVGFSFYDSSGTLLSSDFVDSTGSPTVWTQFTGNISVPAFAATAVPTVRATSHLTGIWCLDNIFATASGGHFVLSSLKSYWSDYCSYR